MSGIILPNGSEQAFLNAYLALVSLTGDGHDFHLYTNDVLAGLTPDQIDALDAGDFTEATFPGYAAVNREGGWTYTQGHPTIARNTVCAFTRSSTGAAQLVYGYFVTFEPGGDLSWFEQFDAPISVEFASDQINITPTLGLDDSEGNMVPTGMLAPYGAAAAPQGWLLCNGAAVSRSTYATLFAVIGTSYGAGDGSTTFNLPDMRQRFPLGQAAAGTGSTLGGTGGAIDHVHDLDTASSHAKVTVGAGSANNLWMRRKSGVTGWTSTHEGDTANLGAAGVAQTTAAELGGSSDAENPPFQVVTYIIKT